MARAVGASSATGTRHSSSRNSKPCSIRGFTMAKNGETSKDIDLFVFEDFNKLLGFEDVWAFEKKFAQV